MVKQGGGTWWVKSGLDQSIRESGDWCVRSGRVVER